MIYKDFQGIKLSRLGMGNMRLPVEDPSDPNSPIDRKKGFEMIDRAMAAGINYYDTAYVYHGGDSERFVGEALKKYPRDSFYVATKFLIGANPDYKAVFEEQLKKLQMDHVDFYLIHSLGDGTIDQYLDCGAIPYFEEQKRLGRIKYLGFSSHASPATLKRMAEQRDWDFAQIQMNYLDWEYSSTKEEYEILHSMNIPIIVMEPVRGGRLADFDENLKKMLDEKRPGKSMASWAFEWVKSKPGVQLILSGMSNMEQMNDNLETFSKEEGLSEDENQLMKTVAQGIKASLTVPCTACRYCCDECPKHLEIPELLKRYNNYKYGSWWNGNELKGIPEDKMPSECIGCGSCTKHCPQTIDIPAYMKKLANLQKTGKEE